MPIVKPYYRIMRETVHGSSFCDYVLDSRYSDDRNMLCRSYKILENDLKAVFEYVEPSDDNLHVYSHRIYELLLRTATEFETNCKRILDANGYTKAGNFNIEDYHKINQATRLSDYEVYIDIWRPSRKLIQPFLNWSNNHSLSWYQGYNLAKHNRNVNFSHASLENLVQAMAGVYCILFAQFGAYSFNAYHQINMIEDNSDGCVFAGESIFSIKPLIWPPSEKYDFDWLILCNQPDPIQRFNFV